MTEKSSLLLAKNTDLQPAACRAARGLLDWTQAELAVAAGVCRSTIRDFEKGRHDLQQGSLAAILSALDLAGVDLLAGPDGVGVRLRPRLTTDVAPPAGRATP